MTDIAPKNDRLVWIDLEMTGLDTSCLLYTSDAADE